MEVYTVNNKNHLLCKYLIGWQVSGDGGAWMLLPMSSHFSRSTYGNFEFWTRDERWAKSKSKL